MRRFSLLFCIPLALACSDKNKAEKEKDKSDKSHGKNK